MTNEKKQIEVELSKCRLNINPEERIMSLVCPQKKVKGTKDCTNLVINMPFSAMTQQEDEEKD